MTHNKYVNKCYAGAQVMLMEKGVTPGSTWEKELPKFCFDARRGVFKSYTIVYNSSI